MEKGELTTGGLHDIYLEKVRPRAKEKVFEAPGSDGKKLGSRKVDDFDQATGTAYEANSHQWSKTSEAEVSRKLKELADDSYLLRDPRQGVKRVVWFGLEELPTTGPAAKIRSAMEALQKQGLNIEYKVIVPGGW